MAEDLLISLPNELLEYILQDRVLTVEDVVHFSSTCRHTRRLIPSFENLWKTKLFQRWTNTEEYYEEDMRTRGMRITNWYEVIKSSFQAVAEMKILLANMLSQNYHKNQLSDVDFVQFDKLFRPEEGANILIYHVLVDELMRIVNEPILKSDLTQVYYAQKVLRYMRQEYLTKEWNHFISLPEDEQLFEKGATYVAQWSQPNCNISYRQISRSLDGIAKQTRNALKIKNPTHPLFSTTKKEQEIWKKVNIADNQWNPADSEEIVRTLCDVMFNTLGFQGNTDLYYSSENSFIDRVLQRRRGIPITLALVFESVARRLGVKCEHISLPTHYLLRWKTKYTDNGTEAAKSFFIDVFNGGKFVTKQNCPWIAGAERRCPIDANNVHKAATTAEIIGRMAGNLEVATRQHTHLNGRDERLRSALELLHMMRPYDTGVILHLARFYMYHQMDLSNRMLNSLQMQTEVTLSGPANRLLQMLEDYKQHLTVVEKSPVVKRRNLDIKYAVGLIMMHAKYNFMCVITGWDYRSTTQVWVDEADELGDLNEVDVSEEPFYHILGEDGSCRYDPETYLEMATVPRYINNEAIGRYFSKFDNLSYVPNEEKEREYPEDSQARISLVNKAYQSFL